MEIVCRINGEERKLRFEPHERLLRVLRRHGYWEVKDGCGEGHCGVCTVLVDNKPVKSCMIFAVQVEGREITTIRGLGTPESPHPIQRAFADEGAVQCGFCAPAMILCTKFLLDRNPTPSEADVRRALSGVLCRCTGYAKIFQAVKAAAEHLREAGA